MAELTHYQVLGLSETANQSEIKQAYRRLAKQHHPDKQTAPVSHDLIARINQAYEVLGDSQARQRYDQERRYWQQAQSVGLGVEADGRTRYERAVDLQHHYQQQRKAEKNADVQLQQWLRGVYGPIDRLIGKILRPLKAEVLALSADPFDDDLMEVFQQYLETCRTLLHQARTKFKSMPNPSSAAKVAANLYYCLNQLEDGIEEMERFTCNYDDSYLHTGQELFRIAARLRREAKEGMKTV
jgi:molecular chaperone DnaJ